MTESSEAFAISSDVGLHVWPIERLGFGYKPVVYYSASFVLACPNGSGTHFSIDNLDPLTAVAEVLEWAAREGCSCIECSSIVEGEPALRLAGE